MMVAEPYSETNVLLDIIEKQTEIIARLSNLLRDEPTEEMPVGTITTTNIPPTIIQDPHITPYYLTDKDLHNVTC